MKIYLYGRPAVQLRPPELKRPWIEDIITKKISFVETGKNAENSIWCARKYTALNVLNVFHDTDRESKLHIS